MAKSKRKNREDDRDAAGRPDSEQGSSEDGRQEAPEIQLDDWQKKFLETKGDKILCTGRQVGKSVICARDAAEWSIRNKNTIVLMIAPTERQAYALFDKTLNYLLSHYPKRVVIKGKERPTKERIILTNGVKIYCLPTGMSGLGIRFLTVGRLYVDEASRVPEDVWSAVTPMLLTTGGDSIYLSTPFGQQGEFYRCWINEDSAYDSFTRFSNDSETVMKNRPICETWTEKTKEKALQKLEQAKARMSKREYAQEYLGQFVEDLFRWFSDELIYNTCIVKRLDYVPPSDNFMGCDIARMGEDEGTIEILHRNDDGTLRHIENIITRKQLTTQTEENIIRTDMRYNCKKIGIDAGAGTLGVSILDHLLRISQVKRKMIALDNKAVRYLDYTKTIKTRILKEDMYENLRSLMEHAQIQLLDDDSVIESLKSVQYEYVMKQGEPTKIRIFGDYTHCVEGIIRGAWLANQKHLNCSISWI